MNRMCVPVAGTTRGCAPISRALPVDEGTLQNPKRLQGPLQKVASMDRDWLGGTLSPSDPNNGIQVVIAIFLLRVDARLRHLHVDARMPRARFDLQVRLHDGSST